MCYYVTWILWKIVMNAIHFIAIWGIKFAITPLEQKPLAFTCIIACSVAKYSARECLITFHTNKNPIALTNSIGSYINFYLLAKFNSSNLFSFQSIRSLFETSPMWRPQERSSTPSTPTACDDQKLSKSWNVISRPVSVVKRCFRCQSAV